MNLEELTRVLPGVGIEEITTTVNGLANKGNGITTGIVIKVSGQCLQQDDGLSIEKTAGSLVFLQEIAHEHRFWPLVITGAGRDIDKALEAAGLPNKKIGGLRYTDDESYPVIAQAMQRKAEELADLVSCYGGKAVAVPMNSGLFMAEGMGQEYGGRTGKATGINIGVLTGLFMPKTFEQPLVIATSLGIDKNGISYNVNADDAAAAAVKMLKPKAYINVTPTGGVLRDFQDKSSLVKMLTVEEAKQLSSDGMAVKTIYSVEEVLKQLPNLHVTVTSPENMVYSLFKIGYGTVITSKTAR